MLRSVSLLAVAALAGFAAVKLVGWVFLPVIGMLLGFLVWALKIAIIVGLIWLGYQVFKRTFGERGSEAG